MPLIRLLDNTKIDRQLWQNCLQESPQNTLYANDWYLDKICPQWKALVSPKNDAYEAVMPLPVFWKWAFAQIRQPLFCQQLGFFSKKKELLMPFLDFLAQNFRYIPKYCLNVENPNTENFIQFKSKNLHTHHLNLGQSYQKIYQNYSTEIRSQLKKAQVDEILESEDICPLIKIFQENIAQKIRGGVSPKAYQELHQLFWELRKRNLARLFYSKKAEKITSGILLVFYQNKIIYLFNAAPHQERKSYGRTFLLDKIFQQYAQSPYVFDFESPDVPQIAHFYTSFGAEAKVFLEISANKLPFWIEKLRQAKFWLTQAVQP